MAALIQYDYVLEEGNLVHKDTCTGPQHMWMETEIRLTSTSRGVAGVGRENYQNPEDSLGIDSPS